VAVESSGKAATTGGSGDPHGRFRERRNSRKGKNTTTEKLKRQSFDGRVPELKGFIRDFKDAEYSSGNRKVCSVPVTFVETQMSAS
jgi:hypothetical protein